MATSTLTPEEEAQLAQTIEMFEVIAQSQPSDYQSLEILKEAYTKLGRDKDIVSTSKRIAQSYVQMGQISSAIFEYETILQRFPDDVEVRAALDEIETKANGLPQNGISDTLIRRAGDTTKFVRAPAKPAQNGTALLEVEDGRRPMHKLFVDSKLISAADFETFWPKPGPGVPGGVVEPFIQLLADKGLVPIDKSLKILSDHSRIAYLPLSMYDLDIDLARTFPSDICQRWCVLPFDRMSKSILVATANPYNQQAAKELAKSTPHRLLWYLVPPAELVKNLRKAFR